MRLTWSRLRAHLPELVGLVVLAVFGAWPALSDGPPTVGDGLNHFYRLAALDGAVQHGVLYPRWLPDMAYGFGVPVFNFYPLLSYWVAEAAHLLGLALPAALSAGYLLAWLVLLTGTRLWAGAVIDDRPHAGLLAALALAATPYLHFNVVHRGAYAELWGLAWLPWLLWAGQRMAHARPEDRRGWALALGALLGLLGLTHALSLFIAVPVLLAWLAGHLRLDDAEQARRRWLPVGTALALGAALSAVFWLPVLAESQFVQLSRTLSDSALSVANNLVPPNELLALPYVYDPLLVFNRVPISLSWPVLVLALVGLWRQRTKPAAWLAGGGALALIVLVLPVSALLWQTLPFVSFVQFPWRLMGPIGVLLALLVAGALVDTRWWVAVLGVAMLLVYVLPASFGPLPERLDGKTHADIPAHERATGQLGTTASGEFLSIWTIVLPDPTRFEQTYAQDALPAARLAEEHLPPGVDLLAQTPGYQSLRFSYTAEWPVTVSVDWLFFPDVQGTVDGVPVTLRPDTVTGMLVVPDLPPGEHEVVLVQRWSRVQRAGGWVSAVAWLALVVLGWVSGCRGSIPRRPAARDDAQTGNPNAVAGVVTGVAGLALLVRLVLPLAGDTLFFRSRLVDGQVAGSVPTDVNYGDALRLVGTKVERDGVWLYWQVPQPVEGDGIVADYSTVVFLEDQHGYRYAQHDSQHPGQVPTTRWQAGQYAADWHPIDPLPGTPPGDYSLVVSVYSAATGGLDVWVDGQPQGQFATVGTYTVAASRTVPTRDALAPQVRLDEPMPPLRLIGADIDRPETIAGGEFYLTLYWEAAEDAGAGVPIELLLMAGDTIVAAQPTTATHRTTAWRAGDRARGPQRFAVPGALTTGTYTITVRAGNRQATVGEIVIGVP